ncbi:hypothetical protein GCHA_1230 [Paraglaciecola chathamensis S18K6]|uniref:Uncharacterized protein n=1 Tax=Paraglaciecola chathamensis S18K6 TaxID=1127672 RepID=A0AAV3UVW6_9ALTE|nr:hypothetical protein GCHA_1230 [Paraglaciecola chathamensis S18K6]
MLPNSDDLHHSINQAGRQTAQRYLPYTAASCDQVSLYGSSVMLRSSCLNNILS